MFYTLPGQFSDCSTTGHCRVSHLKSFDSSGYCLISWNAETNLAKKQENGKKRQVLFPVTVHEFPLLRHFALGGCTSIEAVARESGFESAILIIIGSIK
jgi:hypothetical protein